MEGQLNWDAEGEKYPDVDRNEVLFSVSGRGRSTCKGPEVGKDLMCSREKNPQRQTHPRMKDGSFNIFSFMKTSKPRLSVFLRSFLPPASFGHGLSQRVSWLTPGKPVKEVMSSPCREESVGSRSDRWPSQLRGWALGPLNLSWTLLAFLESNFCIPQDQGRPEALPLAWEY